MSDVLNTSFSLLLQMHFAYEVAKAHYYLLAILNE